MKNFKLFIILISTFSFIEQLRGDEIDDDVTNLKSFFDKLQKDKGFLSRKVYIDDQELSIFNYLNSSNSDGSIDSSAIVKTNVYKLSHLTNIVLSCEYGDITIYYIKVIEKVFSGCLSALSTISKDKNAHETVKLEAINKCFTPFHSDVLDKIVKNISPMILSLTKFVKLTKNYAYKYHDILKILLSWYLYIEHSFKTSKVDVLNYEKRMSRFESIQLTNFQMKNRLERFQVNYCYRPEDVTRFINEIDSDLTKLNDPVPYKELIEKKDERLKSLSYPNIDDVKKNFVINSSDSDFKKLITILSDEVSSKKLNIEWDGIEDMENVFNWYIKNSIDVATILRYEKILLDVVCDIVSSYQINAVEKIISGNDDAKKFEECNNLFKTMITFSSKIGSSDQSAILISYFVRMNSNLSDLCTFIQMKLEVRTTNTIEKMQRGYTGNSLKNISELTKATGLQTFLQKLSGISIFAKLHPSVSNTFWKKYTVYSSSSVEKYRVNYEYLHTNYEKKIKKNKLCDLIMTVSKSFENIEEQLKKCVSKDKNNNLVSNDNFDFTTFNQQYDKLITDVADITINTRIYFDDWARLFLTLYYNKKNIQLFNVDKQKSLDATRRQHLITFIHAMKNVLLENQFVECKCGVLSDLKNSNDCTGDESWEAESPLEHSNGKIDELHYIKKLKEILSYEGSFQPVTKSVQILLKNFQLKAEFKLYLDGTEMELNEVHTNYELRTFDLQDAHDYVNFFIKWLIVTLHTKLIEIFSILIEKPRELTLEEVSSISSCVNNFLNRDLVRPNVLQQLAPVIRHFRYIIVVLSSFYTEDAVGTNNTEKIEKLRPFLKIADFVEGSQSDKNKTSNDISTLFTEINRLSTFFDVYM